MHCAKEYKEWHCCMKKTELVVWQTTASIVHLEQLFFCLERHNFRADDSSTGVQCHDVPHNRTALPLVCHHASNLDDRVFVWLRKAALHIQQPCMMSVMPLQSMRVCDDTLLQLYYLSSVSATSCVKTLHPGQQYTSVVTLRPAHSMSTLRILNGASLCHSPASMTSCCCRLPFRVLHKHVASNAQTREGNVRGIVGMPASFGRQNTMQQRMARVKWGRHKPEASLCPNLPSGL